MGSVLTKMQQNQPVVRAEKGNEAVTRRDETRGITFWKREERE